jgi:uncharacterized membrane protein YuzA (DUF378 family)
MERNMAVVNDGTRFPTKPVSRFNVADWIALVLMIIGAINWGLVGAFGFNLVSAIFGEMSTLSRIIYVLVGLAGLYGIGLALKLRQPAL